MVSGTCANQLSLFGWVGLQHHPYVLLKPPVDTPWHHHRPNFFIHSISWVDHPTKESCLEPILTKSSSTRGASKTVRRVHFHVSLKCPLTLTDCGCSVSSYSFLPISSGRLSKSPLSRSSSLHHWVPYHCCGMPSSPVYFLAMSSLHG